MSDPVPALGGARMDGMVTIEEMPPRGMIAVRADLSDAAAADAIATATGLSVPEPLRASAEGDTALFWMSPDEALVLCGHTDAPAMIDRLREALGDRHCLVADVSDARSVFRLTGPALRDVLAKLTPANLSPGAFAVGSVRRTRLAQIPAALWLREEEVAEILCFRSVARYAFDLLANAAAPDSEVGFLSGRPAG